VWIKLVSKVKLNVQRALPLLYFGFNDMLVKVHESAINKFGIWNQSDNNEVSPSIVAITVSTGYDDLLELILPKNQEYFEKWIIVTDKKDSATKALISQFPNIDVISLRFKTLGRVFNKGLGVRKAQLHAYRNFPNSWYLLLDSDIILSDEFSYIVKHLDVLPKDALYGCNVRRDFSKLSELRLGINFSEYFHGGEIHGYFQLYTKKYLYRDSIDASWCDLQFGKLFSTHTLMNEFHCDHLGMKGNWTGRKSRDFVFD
jgi:hypothetical protein